MTSDEFIKKVNSAYKTNIIGGSSIDIDRFSSDVVLLDASLGGGWLYNRINLIAGPESSGKTYLVTKAIKSILNYCKTCRKHKNHCKCSMFVKSTVFFADCEGTFDYSWAENIGISKADLANIVYARTQTGEQTADIVETAIKENIFDLIIIDSLAAMIPAKEIEDSMEDNSPGIQARLLNKAFRKWLSAFSYHKGSSGPSVILTNQLRTKFTLFGDPRVMPGGEAQKFYPSIIVWTNSSKIKDDPNEAVEAKGLFGGVVKKNKTYVPKGEFAYDLYFKDTSVYKKGDSDNYEALFTLGKKYDLILKKDGNWNFGNKIIAKSEDEFVLKLKDVSLMHLLWRSIIHRLTGKYYL